MASVLGRDSETELSKAAERGEVIAIRGWAIVALSRIATPEAKKTLERMVQTGDPSSLVRHWAAAGRIAASTNLAELARFAAYQYTYPPTQRTLRKRALALAGDADLESMLALVRTNPQLGAIVQPVIMASGADSLAKVMIGATDMGVRQTAAAYLASLGARDGASVGAKVVDSYAFDGQARAVPWQGGPLYIPSIPWQRDQARALMTHLVHWLGWATQHKQTAEAQKILINLGSVGLQGAAGVRLPSFRGDATHSRHRRASARCRTRSSRTSPRRSTRRRSRCTCGRS